MKTYVAVVALHTLDGKVRPLFIVWENNIKYPIDRIIEVRKAASLKNGGSGIRFICSIQGHHRTLYYENPKWFIEK